MFPVDCYWFVNGQIGLGFCPLDQIWCSVEFCRTRAGDVISWWRQQLGFPPLESHRSCRPVLGPLFILRHQWWRNVRFCARRGAIVFFAVSQVHEAKRNHSCVFPENIAWCVASICFSPFLFHFHTVWVIMITYTLSSFFYFIFYLSFFLELKLYNSRTKIINWNAPIAGGVFFFPSPVVINGESKRTGKKWTSWRRVTSRLPSDWPTVTCPPVIGCRLVVSLPECLLIGFSLPPSSNE